MKLEDVLNLLYSKEINCSVASFWDGGWTFSLGDQANGFKDSDGPYYDLLEGAAWLLGAAHKHYPEAFE